MPKKKKVYNRLTSPARESYYDIFKDLSKSRDWEGIIAYKTHLDVSKGKSISYKDVTFDFIVDAHKVLLPLDLVWDWDLMVTSHFFNMGNKVFNKLIEEGWYIYDFEPNIYYVTNSVTLKRDMDIIDINMLTKRSSLYIKHDNGLITYRNLTPVEIIDKVNIIEEVRDSIDGY